MILDGATLSVRDISKISGNPKIRIEISTEIEKRVRESNELLDRFMESGRIICGVTTEVCVHTTVREANDRGYECLVLEDCVGSYFPEFQRVGIEMIKAQGGIFGWVVNSNKVISALESIKDE